MPNLVGIGNSQVPTNAMLGGLAYQDSVGEIVIDKIKARASDTAIDIFVYDTRKDSDGGAWRKKATKQSWYNENVSERRGARKEFPAVAVIVVQSSYVTIYDGDDPNLPMWMEFTVNNSPAQIIFTSPSCAHMLNGVLVVGTNPNATNNDYWDGGIKVFNFISDKIRSYSGTRSMIYDMNISERNDPKIQHYDTTNVLVSPNVSAVTMFVLPNAKIDVNTGLPIPTILAATRRGISAVRDSGVVFDMLVTIGGGSNYKTHSIEITKDLKILHNWSDRASDRFSYLNLIPLSLLESDSSYGYEYQFRNEATYQYNVGGGVLDIFDSVNTFFKDVVPTELGYFAIGSDNGLVNVQHIPMALNNGGRSTLGDARFSGGMHCRITNNFNTGWLFNNIKGAFLSDTDTTNVTGETINLTNGSAQSGQAGNFSSISANSLVAGTIASGALGRYNTGTDGSVLVVGRQYLATLTISNYNGSGDLGVASGAGFDSSFRYSANGTYTTYITYDSGEVQIFYRNTNTATIGLSLQEVVVDRSVRNKGLGINGTITKSAVATGAELVAYSGFSDSNYLKQPYNSDLDFGTGDLCIMFWANFTQNDAYDTIMARRAHNGSAYTGNGWYVEMGNDQAIQIKNSSGVTKAQIDPDSVSGAWEHMCFVRKDDVGYGYKNGVLQSNTYTWNENLDNSSAILTIGRGTISGSGDADKTSLALVRISKGAPSADQINKIYNDEKCLFNENAKCTLYGTSDNIKAIVYDDSIDVTHVGTSAGRSEFQGLIRINNTTTAVTTKISASNEFVAEQ